MAAQLKVVIEAGLTSGGQDGGVEQFVMGLVSSLGRLADGDEIYIIVALERDSKWLRPFLGPNQKLVPKPDPLWRILKRIGPLGLPARAAWRAGRRLLTRLSSQAEVRIPVSDGFYESLDADVVHFPFQYFVDCELPAVFNPHDLQHLYFPQFFTRERLAWRETIYPEACRRARAVVAESHATKDDLVRFYGLAPHKVHVIPRGSPTALFHAPPQELVERVALNHKLPPRFALYPAQTWPHKNHLRLLEAVALLRERNGLRINLVCTGRKNDYWPNIEKQIREMSLSSQVFFLGYITPQNLKALYRLAHWVVFPTLFEGGGFPVIEGFQEGVPVACSAIPALEQFSDATLQFDPTSVESIAQALATMWSDANLRTRLKTSGANRIRLLSWERTGKTYRALYRTLAGRPLLEEDRRLLAYTQSCTAEIGGEPSVQVSRERHAEPGARA